MAKVYVAGPDVFRANAKDFLLKRKQQIQEKGLEALIPGDNVLDLSSLSPHGKAKAIYVENVRLLNECQGVIANLEPFRGPGVDDGTAWEIGYAYAQGKPIVGYSSYIAQEYAELKDLSKEEVSREFTEWEDFGRPANLMIAESILEKSASLYKTFEEALEEIKQILAR